MNTEEGWVKPTDKADAKEITIKSLKKQKAIIPEQIEKRIGAINYQENESFQIGKNGKAILNRQVPAGYRFTVYARIIIEKIEF